MNATSARSALRSTTPVAPGARPSPAMRSRRGRSRRLLYAPSATRTTKRADFTRTARPNALSRRSSKAPRWTTDCRMPLARSTATAVSATGENLDTAAARSLVRSAPSSRRVAAGTANRSSATPPSQALMAATCSTFAGTRSSESSPPPACPARAGASSRIATGTLRAPRSSPEEGPARSARRAPRRRRGAAPRPSQSACSAHPQARSGPVPTRPTCRMRSLPEARFPRRRRRPRPGRRRER